MFRMVYVGGGGVCLDGRMEGSVCGSLKLGVEKILMFVSNID